jgi:hypothetical protein
MLRRGPSQVRADSQAAVNAGCTPLMRVAGLADGSARDSIGFAA